MAVAICICSKYPNLYLYTCIENLYKHQINKDPEKIYNIHVIDSDSSDLIYYKDIERDFPRVNLHFIKNKNYEYGAWKHIYMKYPQYNIFFCIQDTICINKYIDLNVLNNNTAMIFFDHAGYYSDPPAKPFGLEVLRDSNLSYETIIDVTFTMAQHNCFIVKNNIIKDIFNHLTIPPNNKIDACSYERIFGIYFIAKGINTINLFDYMEKIHGGRD
jgi:hypothetical protein